MVLQLQGMAHVRCPAHSVIVSVSLDCLLHTALTGNLKNTMNFMMIGFVNDFKFADELMQYL